MNISLTKVTDRETPEHWRIFVTEGEREIYLDSASSKPLAILRIVDFLHFLQEVGK